MSWHVGDRFTYGDTTYVVSATMETLDGKGTGMATIHRVGKKGVYKVPLEWVGHIIDRGMSYSFGAGLSGIAIGLGLSVVLKGMFL